MLELDHLPIVSHVSQASIAWVVSIQPKLRVYVLLDTTAQVVPSTILIQARVTSMLASLKKVTMLLRAPLKRSSVQREPTTVMWVVMPATTVALATSAMV